ncbi:lipopolysaccharide assembly protein LapA domain-containing protein [Arthrobacter sp. ES3-54]|uniref:LapA family protein n=1 Tax=Arthrobacter sp. ES3-54 TaxID=1502991 RepID=UPI0024066B69|nr:lipopolysaccharide assembly protein LapA domain-containing protein [Arthrobacter sp. ES3-54]MDF9750340.1 putative integral membrane protein [Arthrobacter sp. ES3-54]
MTETPRSFDPNHPDDVRTTQPPGAADAGSGTGTSEVETSRPEAPAAPAPEPARAPEARQVTRAGMVWAAVACALVVLIVLIAFILQNQEYVQVKFFGLEGSVPLGMALFIAAVGGGVLVAIAGAARIIQLRLAAHRVRRQASGTRTR